MAAAPMAFTLASAGLSVASGISQGQGQAAAYKAKEAAAQRQAFDARTAADQTDSALRDELHITLGNIDAIRAAAGIDSTSPTGQAIAENEAKVSDRQRRIRVGNLLSQADQSEADARYYNSAAGSALGMGLLGGVASGFNKLSALKAA